METTHTPQRALIKLLAIVGFFAFAVLAIWLIVQGIRAFPSAFTSLASIAESINNYRPHDELVVKPEKNIVNSGEIFTITWNDMGKGTYSFHSNCSDNVTIKVKTDEGALRTIPCTDDLTLPEGVHGLFASIDAGAQRFSEVSYTITFNPAKGDSVTKENRVTVVNATVPQPVVVVVPEPEKEPAPAPTPVVTPTPKPATTPTPIKTTPVLVPSYPPSLPNGFVDLQITYLGAGTIVNGAFLPKTSFDEDLRAAFQFQVKNIGTKTSDTWSYELGLPEDRKYEGGTQAPLRPTEYAIFTVGFDLTDTKSTSVTLTGDVDVASDANTKNDSFSRVIKITN